MFAIALFCDVFVVAESQIIQKFKKQLGTHEMQSRDLQIQEPLAEGMYAQSCV